MWGPPWPTPRPPAHRGLRPGGRVRRDVHMQLFSLLMNASLSITASWHASLPWCDGMWVYNCFHWLWMPHFPSPHFAMPGLGQGSGPGIWNLTVLQKPLIWQNRLYFDVAVAKGISVDILSYFCIFLLSTGQKIRQDKQDEQDYFIFHHGKS